MTCSRAELPSPPTLAASASASRSAPHRRSEAPEPLPRSDASRSCPDNVRGCAPLSFRIYSAALSEPTMHCYFRPRGPAPSFPRSEGKNEKLGGGTRRREGRGE